MDNHDNGHNERRDVHKVVRSLEDERVRDFN